MGRALGVDKDLRASLIASGAAAVLSMIVGFASGIGILVLFLRAVVGGIAFGAVVYGGFSLARRFLPELFTDAAGAGGTAAAEAPGADAQSFDGTGAAVNIVLPGDEAPEGFSGSIVENSVLAGALGAEDVEDAVAADEPLGLAAQPPRASSGSARGPAAAGGSPAPEARKPRLFASRAPAQAEEEDFSYASESLLDEGEGGLVEGAAPLQAPRMAEGIDSLDALPDLESLSGGFGPVVPEAGAEAHEYEEPSPRIRASASMGTPAGSDPAMLAQAVRTLLKRDQER
jgi:hypothetical protein